MIHLLFLIIAILFLLEILPIAAYFVASIVFSILDWLLSPFKRR